MTNSKPWHVLNIDVTNAVRKDFDFAQLLVNNDEPLRVWDYFGDKQTELFDSSWLEYMESIGLALAGGLIFWRSANFYYPAAHIDMPFKGLGNGAAFNWAIGPDSGEMVWYRLPEHAGDQKITSVGSDYQEWPTVELTEISRRIIGNQCTLVRVDVPHNINMFDVPRLLITARTIEPFANWEEIVKKFKPWIIDNVT